MTTRREFLDSIGKLAAGFRQKIEAEVDGFSPNPAEGVLRRQNAQASLEFFAKTYFPHYVTRANSVLHNYLYSRLVEIADSPRAKTDAIAAPRGEAKSTITTQIFVLWCVLTGRKHYPIIGMDAFDQAAIMLEAIKAELEFNPRLLLDYPEAAGVGRLWNAGVIVTRNNVKIEAVGSGKRIRGRRHGPYRPDLFIGDDLENDENVKTPEQRDKLQGWITKAVLKLGGAGEKFDAIIIGTILHYDSVLARLLANPLWHGRKFKALIQWPDRMDLWQRWEERLLNDGVEVARAFYDAQAVGHAALCPTYDPGRRLGKAEGVPNTHPMEAGAIVSWPAGRPLYDLMLIRARDGHAAFDSELQNDPIAGDNAPFANVIDGNFWVELPPDLIFYGAVDPSLGRHGASRDPSALLVGGLDRKTGVLYVVEAAIAKRLPDKIIEDTISLHARYRCVVWAVENVQFQEFLRTELIKRSAARGIPVPARAVSPTTDKLLRIETLQPHLANGLIRLHPSQTVLIEQLRHFPKADHDDGPDALHMLWMLAVTGAGKIEFTAAPMRGADHQRGGW